MTENRQAARKVKPAAALDDEKSSITLANKVDIQFMENANGERAHSMTGFDPRYRDFVDYIIGVTHEIWEEKAIGKLYDYYANAVKMHTSSGTIHGRQAVFAGTIEAMAAYPDRRLYGEEVIWGGNDADGFYSSHRLRHEGTNRGWSQYGPPTGKRVSYGAVADCFCKKNMVVEEWLVRDELSLVIQLGLDPIATAKKMAKKERDKGLKLQIAGDVERGIGQLPPPKMPEAKSDRFDPEDFVRRMIHEIWNWRLLNKAREYYHESSVFEGPTPAPIAGHQRLSGLCAFAVVPFPRFGAGGGSFLLCGRCGGGISHGDPLDDARRP